ncbi:MAG TPA: ribosome-associated translation inhibitor RaiA [Candidatus Dormibacteraeota bacterium]|nr:ribosome-associated translation inhibitor RaiA [Candidatus Dormibacteraeota bacterium]
MLQKFEIRGVHSVVDDNLRKYVTKKIGRLDRYLSQHNRQSVHTEVYLKESKAKDKKQCTCEVTMYLPHETINLKESTLNMYAAIDIVETKLKLQIKKYKERHNNSRLRRRLLARWRNKVDNSNSLQV